MQPFGGTQYCPRCEKAVYAAEQVMGPGRKSYHKPCLACTICSKRLDSYTLLEHQQQPYCKSCHRKNFGTRDLRQANLTPSPEPKPRKIFQDSPSWRSPLSSEDNMDSDATTCLPSLLTTGVSAASTLTKFPSSIEYGKTVEFPDKEQLFNDVYNLGGRENREAVDQDSLSSAPKGPSTPSASTGIPSNTGRPGLGGIPRTVPLTSKCNAANGTNSPTDNPSTGRSLDGTPAVQDTEQLAPFDNNPQHHLPNTKPILQTATGTRYSATLGRPFPAQLTGSTGSPKKWGAMDSNPGCPRCGKTVYFAEQVRAVGKTYHKNCLRCTECNTLLDSSRLRDHGGEPLCVRCYGKLHGPQGGGYALLGKAGG